LNKKVSVIVPIYNVEKYLEKCLISITHQSYKDIEIILVNDGSTDGSLSICQKYEKIDTRIHLINKSNGGLSSARNAGIDFSSGEYLVFIDSDDFIHLKMIEYMLTSIMKDKTDICICNIQDFYKDKILFPIDEIKTEPNKSILSSQEVIGWFFGLKGKIATVSCNKIYKSILFENIRFPIGKIHEDVFVTYRVIQNAQMITFIDNPFYFYLQRNDSITKIRFNDKSYDYLEGFKNMIDNIKYDEVYVKKNHALKKYYTVLKNYYFLTMRYLPKNKIKLNKLRDEIFNLKLNNKYILKSNIEKIEFFLMINLSFLWYILKLSTRGIYINFSRKKFIKHI